MLFDTFGIIDTTIIGAPSATRTLVYKAYMDGFRIRFRKCRSSINHDDVDCFSNYNFQFRYIEENTLQLMTRIFTSSFLI